MREDVACHFDPSDQWVEIDTPEDYTLARQKFAREGKGS
jgi:choline kinase